MIPSAWRSPPSVFSRSPRFIRFTARPGEGPTEQDLGNIKLEQDAQTLSAVTVVGQKPALQMGIDRKTFDVEKSLVATGGSAIDVMKNIPSVSVDVDGNVVLRNQSPQIFVDGRPTILTLDQISANDIERIELITNPSARFDAASVGGVINIILKKNRKLGLNGMASVGAGAPGILNGNLNLNLRQDKFNFFVSGNYNRQGGIAKGESFRQNILNGVKQDWFNQQSEADSRRRFASVRFGADYFLDNRNTLSITQGFTNGQFRTDEDQDQAYYTAAGVLDRTGDRTSNNRSRFDRANTQLIYKHKFAEPGKELNADINYSWGNGNNNTNILNRYFNPDGSSNAPDNIVRNQGSDDNNQLTIQVDFTDPRGENAKLETGVRTYLNEQTSLFNSYSRLSGVEVKLPLSNHYNYREMVNAAYVTYTDKIGGIGYQLGLRAEHSKFDGTLIDSAMKFGYEYPSDFGNLFNALFPSVFLSKEVGDGNELQLNYTRRIRRPNFWQLNPFVDINDPLNLRQGNPALKPEFTNSFEFNYNKTYGTGSFLGVVYYRYSTDEITQYSDTITAAKYEQLNNAAVDPNAILNTFINANSEQQWGAELTLQQKIGSQFDLTPTFNLQYMKVKANVNNLDLSNEGFNWETKLTLNYRLASTSPVFNKLAFQLISEYESPEVIPQGKRKARYNTDVAVKKDFLKDNKASITFNVNDVFNHRRWGTIYDTETFYQDSYRRRNVRNFRITFAYKFGKTDFALFRKQRSEGGGREEEM
ncbi:MAG: TonB-dependent receptor [Candidatus Pseudobacter hemicellulosilyticus]|uniref:TonB-dependent receptor n=1 Tax=Candidatus Pseudobacter hemicellulosilyticus TaxID=3121375 RepID=A0AAJ6BH39_9BACT|nr:MAG: TonB-dependent receptor [Pseudobacter sp.]